MIILLDKVVPWDIQQTTIYVHNDDQGIEVGTWPVSSKRRKHLEFTFPLRFHYLKKKFFTVN